MARVTKARSCTGKVRYPHWMAACDALGNNPEMHPYACKYCGGFHLGHPRKGDSLPLPTRLFPKVEETRLHA